MDKKTFIETLRRALYGKLDAAALEEHVRYYDRYISQETANGRSEKSVLDELGDPRLIARTILETADMRAPRTRYTIDEDQVETEERIHVHRFSGWKATLILALFAALVLALAVLAFQLLLYLLPVLLVLAAVSWLFRRFW
ncbi:MAG: DUF1700 domain-containing protein [Eubacteriales bacterium]|nr:DUF1700 domain-containing protein [Eubacteriales bacterium]